MREVVAAPVVPVTVPVAVPVTAIWLSDSCLLCFPWPVNSNHHDNIAPSALKMPQQTRAPLVKHKKRNPHNRRPIIKWSTVIKHWRGIKETKEESGLYGSIADSSGGLVSATATSK